MPKKSSLLLKLAWALIIKALDAALQKLILPTMPMPGSLTAASLSPEPNGSHSHLFILGSTVNARIKLHILKGLFVPFEVLLAANQGRDIDKYICSPFLTTDSNSKLCSLLHLLSIEEWTDAFVIYTCVYCTRFLEQQGAMNTHMGIIRHLATIPLTHAWMGYDREFCTLRQDDPSLV